MALTRCQTEAEQNVSDSQLQMSFTSQTNRVELFDWAHWW